MCFHQKFLQWGFCSLIVVLMPKIRCASKNNFYTSDNPCKGVQKNMLKAYNFTKNKICHRCFDNNFHKRFQTKIHKDSKDTFDICYNGWLMTYTSNGDSWLKLSYLYLSSIFKYLHLNFKNCNVFICRDTSRTS